MKPHWESRKLVDLLEVQNGYAFKSKQFSVDGEIPLIRIRDINPGTSTETRYSGEYDTRYMVQSGDMLVGMDGNFECHVWKGPDSLLNQRVCRLQNFNTGLHSKFLFYGINQYLQEIHDVTGFTTVKHLSSKSIKEISFPLPPLPEQERIVAILDEAFAAIATATAHAEKNLANARELFESELNRTFSQKGEGWVEKPLATVSSILNGYAFKSTDFAAKSGVRCIKITNVGVKEFVSNSDGYLPDGFASEYSKVSVKKDSIVIALTRTIIAGGLKVAVVPNEYDGALLNQRVASVITNETQLTGAFLFAYLSAQTVVNYVTERVNTLMQPNLSITDLRSMPIPVPPLCEQDKTTNQLNGLREETQRLEALYQQKLTALAELKQSILQKAFAGELTGESQSGDWRSRDNGSSREGGSSHESGTAPEGV